MDLTENIDSKYILVLLNQIRFFNHHYHVSEEDEHQVSFHQLMRNRKHRCQLMLLQTCTPEQVWILQDLDSPNQEWLVGGIGLNEKLACHIPQHVLEQGLSEELLEFWKIKSE